LCKEVVSKTSAIIAGSTTFKRIDRNVLNALFTSLKKVTNVGAEAQLVTGFLNSEANAMGAALCGLSVINKEELNNASVVYLVGEDHNVDTLTSLMSDPNKLIIYQGCHNQFFTNSSDLVLPAKSLLETAGLFVSFDSRVQKSNVVSNGIGEAKSHNEICSVFSSSLLGSAAELVSLSLFTPALLNVDFSPHSFEIFIPSTKVMATAPNTFLAFGSTLYYSHKQRFARVPYVASVFDFHIVNTLTRASKLMVKCSQASRLNHRNFISL
jgi:NADH dehydrogenase/NADH:ubiquinone oxidoreductase subunit G